MPESQVLKSILLNYYLFYFRHLKKLKKCTIISDNENSFVNDSSSKQDPPQYNVKR